PQPVLGRRRMLRDASSLVEDEHGRSGWRNRGPCGAWARSPYHGGFQSCGQVRSEPTDQGHFAVGEVRAPPLAQRTDPTPGSLAQRIDAAPVEAEALRGEALAVAQRALEMAAGRLREEGDPAPRAEHPVEAVDVVGEGDPLEELPAPGLVGRIDVLPH